MLRASVQSTRRRQVDDDDEPTYPGQDAEQCAEVCSWEQTVAMPSRQKQNLFSAEDYRSRFLLWSSRLPRPVRLRTQPGFPYRRASAVQTDRFENSVQADKERHMEPTGHGLDTCPSQMCRTTEEQALGDKPIVTKAPSRSARGFMQNQRAGQSGTQGARPRRPVQSYTQT